MEPNLIDPNYSFPEYYSWPYFFTIQKHAETRLKQLTMWAEVTLNFCKDHKIWRISKSVFYANLGKNSKINRKLPMDKVEMIFDFMVDKNIAMYTKPKSKDEVFLLWKSLNEWEEFLYSAAIKHQRIERLETLDYITNDDDNQSEEFYEMDRDLLILILQNLESQGKCTLLCDDNNTYVGVKFIK